MKTIGLLGGMSWQSTITYYQRINEAIGRQLGGYHSAKLLLYSVDFDAIEKCQSLGDWQRSAALLYEAVDALEKGGADFIVICTNTMHKIFPELQAHTQLPILHIADATAAELHRKHIKKAALLGTKYTMQQDFYKQKLQDAGIEVLLPDANDMDTVNRIIYEELCMGNILPASKREYLRIIEGMAGQGAAGVILGCTEIGLLLSQKDTQLPVFDTTEIHAAAAVRAALQE